jgi:endogenous inhibitor of DNA gyrase (YacG/DUF329 family)
MTIREYLKRRGNRLTNWFMASLVTSVLCVVFARNNFPLLYSSIVLMFGMMLVLIFGMSRTPCPRCGKRLGNTASAANNPFSKRAQFCPHCGLSVDEPMESAKRG